jgi:hypothetical protein
MKTTAIDWLLENYSLVIPSELIIRAKEIEKMQIIEAYQSGEAKKSKGSFPEIQYYNETFIDE